MKVLWYISPVDGRRPWVPEGRFPVDHARLRRTAQTVDRGGFYGALFGTYAHDVFITVTSLISVTERMRFLIPIYPGVTPPSLLAQQALTFDDYSGGRLLFNLVNGTDKTLARYGVDVEHDERYEMSAEYWKLFKRLYKGENVTHRGKYFNISGRDSNVLLSSNLPLGPVQSPCIPLWGAGASPAGIGHAAQVVDVYLAFLRNPADVAKQIQDAKAAAALQGRTLEFGALASVVVRETEEEAIRHFQQLLESTGAEAIARSAHEALIARGVHKEGLNGISSSNPKVQARIDALRAGRLPRLEDLEIAPNMYAGMTGWGALLDLPGEGAGTYIVGSAQQVADRLKWLQSEVGIDNFILSGWPQAQEAEYTAELLLPLLDLDHEPPVLAPKKQ
ncbi:MAG: LLM class flavin-dependent oxidoreductase [Spongiibacteraceae bacterium]|jgi:alkanesulfonate monooxygenase|nr:LLM class flavin-dependent oxidoreductase [Spongiibacteraceae bacterium]